MIIQCADCGVGVEAKNSRKKYCDSCAKERKLEYNRAYREANKERNAEYNRAYREANKERNAEYNRAYREANRERVIEQERSYRARKKAERLALQAATN